MESQNWALSQFMHGEQGALVCTAKLLRPCPGWTQNIASTQVVDEARHVEVFAKYLDTKLSDTYPINVHLRMLLDEIIEDSCWDMTYPGMQIMVEGLALAAFGFMYQQSEEPLLKQLLRYVMSDEARHVAFGLFPSKRLPRHDSSGALERQEFAFEAAVQCATGFCNKRCGNAWALMSKVIPWRIKTRFSRSSNNCCLPRLFQTAKAWVVDAGDGWLERNSERSV